MAETITYQYAAASALNKIANEDQLFLSKYNESQKGESPCFFWGKLNEPYFVARCLMTLSNVVQSSFNLSPFQMALLKDPIVTSGNDKIRFEGFSHCAGVYARLDILNDGLDGEFIENGTTNVDFNQPMINALGKIRNNEKVFLSIGPKEVGLHKEGEKIIERKVPLPEKWIKGLTSVQVYLSKTERVFSLNRLQAIQLIRSIPKGKPKTDYYLGLRGNKVFLSPTVVSGGICIGGIHRLRLLENLIPFSDKLDIYAQPDMQSTTWQLYLGSVRFTLSVSRDTWRGFSGEGAALESLIEDVPNQLIEKFDNFSYANQSFNPTILSIKEDIDLKLIDNLGARLSAMGLLGYDLNDNEYFYRRLPFKLSRIISLNPRLKNAEKLIEDNKVEIINKSDSRIEASVEGSGVKHTVIITDQQKRCTCTWFAQHQGERGVCKHILAVLKLTQNQ